MAIGIIDVVTRVDLELLKEQTRTLSSVIDHLTDALDRDDFDDIEEKGTIEADRDNLEGLLEFLDNVIISLGDL